MINSLLDVRGLARTSGSGAACTCVATEYVYREGEGYGVEVEWFERDEVEGQVREVVEGYRDFHLRGEEDDEDEDEDEVRELGERARVAEDLGRAMFRGWVEGGNVGAVLLGRGVGGEVEGEEGEEEDEEEDDDEEEDEEDGDDEEDDDKEEERVVRQLMSWVDEMPRQITGEERFDDAEACSRRLMELTSDLGGEDEVALWPFIRKIRCVGSAAWRPVLNTDSNRVSCNAHILSKGLILVDLPGKSASIGSTVRSS